MVATGVRRSWETFGEEGLLLAIQLAPGRHVAKVSTAPIRVPSSASTGRRAALGHGRRARPVAGYGASTSSTRSPVQRGPRQGHELGRGPSAVALDAGRSGRDECRPAHHSVGRGGRERPRSRRRSARADRRSPRRRRSGRGSRHAPPRAARRVHAHAARPRRVALARSPGALLRQRQRERTVVVVHGAIRAGT